MIPINSLNTVNIFPDNIKQRAIDRVPLNTMTYEFYSGLIVGIISGICLVILMRSLMRMGTYSSHPTATEQAPEQQAGRRPVPFIRMDNNNLTQTHGGEEPSLKRMKEKLRQFKIRNQFYTEFDDNQHRT